MSEPVMYGVSGGVATLTLNRPQVMNALDADAIRQLRAACERARDDDDIRCIVLRGNGPAFLAGGDVTWFHANLPDLAGPAELLAGEFHLAIAALRAAGKPVLASVHGAIAGAGVSLLAAADLGIAANDAKFSLAYSRIAASPDGGSTWFLPRLMGARKALELMLLADTFDAGAALAYGLVNWVMPAAQLAAETDRIAQRLAHGPTGAYAQTKALVNQSFERSLEAQLAAEARAFARCAGTADFAEGVTAFVEKRAPRFGGP